MLLIDIGLTILGGPTKSPSSFFTELLALPAHVKGKVSDLVFCHEHENPNQLLKDISTLFHINLSSEQRALAIDYWNNQLTACRPLPGAAEFCSFIVDSGYPYCIASNLWKPFHEALVHYLPSFEKNAERTFFSYKVAARKPSDPFYDLVYSMLGDPQKSLMVGDSLENDIMPCLSRGASAILLHSERYYPEESLSEKLHESYPTSSFFMASNHLECQQIITNHFNGAVR